jgi:hypothetical protein
MRPGIMLVCLLCACALPLHAQAATPEWTDAERAEPAAAPWAEIAKTLHLDKARATRLQALLEAGQAYRQALRTRMKTAASDAERDATVRAMRAALRDVRRRLATVLTPAEMSRLEREQIPAPLADPA